MKSRTLFLSILLTQILIHMIRTVCNHLLHSKRRAFVEEVHPGVLALFLFSLVGFLVTVRSYLPRER